MSIATWKEEFYPVDASKCPQDEAVAHSLRKWKGLRPDALRAHGLAANYSLRDAGGATFPVDVDTCALCKAHTDCDTCPLYKVRGGRPCDMATESEEENGQPSPFEAWQEKSNPEPMIAALEAAARLQGAAS